jgi:hypothetical protein
LRMAEGSISGLRNGLWEHQVMASQSVCTIAGASWVRVRRHLPLHGNEIETKGLAHQFRASDRQLGHNAIWITVTGEWFISSGKTRTTRILQETAE